MQVDQDILNLYEIETKCFCKNEIIFKEGDYASDYYQILEGEVVMFYVDEDGKEFNIGIFGIGQSFGEPPLFVNKPYPASAIVRKDCILIRLTRKLFFKMLQEHPEIQIDFLKTFAIRIYHKISFSKNIINKKPEFRVFTFIKNYKEQNNIFNERVLIPFTRKEIADFTGLRVETVIRTLSSMKKRKIIQIIDHKVYF